MFLQLKVVPALADVTRSQDQDSREVQQKSICHGIPTMQWLKTLQYNMMQITCIL